MFPESISSGLRTFITTAWNLTLQSFPMADPDMSEEFRFLREPSTAFLALMWVLWWHWGTRIIEGVIPVCGHNCKDKKIEHIYIKWTFSLVVGKYNI
jgi:hypothetical protein